MSTVTDPAERWQVGAFYKFFDHPGFKENQKPLQVFCEDRGLRGTILLATEGVNGTVAGRAEAIAALIQRIETIPGATPLEVKWSEAEKQPFYRMKVRLKNEIVTLGEPGISPVETVGDYVEPADWNRLIADPGVVVVDTRNDYEVRIGKFRGARDPKTASFREFPDYVARDLDPATTPRVAMYCTGGIRCEKATALLKKRGFKEVYHLKGGILRYLEEMDPAESLWEGECFVFDQRVSVGHGLKPGPLELCGGCREPLTAEDRNRHGYERGVSCHYCVDTLTPDKRAAARERQRQIDLARKRGEVHLGR